MFISFLLQPPSQSKHSSGISPGCSVLYLLGTGSLPRREMTSTLWALSHCLAILISPAPLALLSLRSAKPQSLLPRADTSPLPISHVSNACRPCWHLPSLCPGPSGWQLCPHVHQLVPVLVVTCNSGRVPPHFTSRDLKLDRPLGRTSGVLWGTPSKSDTVNTSPATQPGNLPTGWGTNTDPNIWLRHKDILGVCWRPCWSLMINVNSFPSSTLVHKPIIQGNQMVQTWFTLHLPCWVSQSPYSPSCSQEYGPRGHMVWFVQGQKWGWLFDSSQNHFSCPL